MYFYLSYLFIFHCLLCCPLSGPNDTYLWTTVATQANMQRSDALTVDATSYALLAAVQLEKNEIADKIASWLTTQENYGGGFHSSQVVWMLCLKKQTNKEKQSWYLIVINSLYYSSLDLKMLNCHFQDTLSALEALAEYELKRPAIPESRMEAEFTAQGRRDVIRLVYDGKDRVETNLKVRWNNISIFLQHM